MFSKKNSRQQKPSQSHLIKDRPQSPLQMERLEHRLLMKASAPWGVWNQFIYQDATVASFPTITGKGQTVAVIDTGISSVPSLKGKIVAGYNFVNNNSNYSDKDGHGTSVAGVIAASAYTVAGRRYQGIAPGAKLVALKVDDGVNQVPENNIKRALAWVVTNAAKYNIVAVNLSEGTGFFSNHNATSSYSNELATLRNQGIFVAAASGNESQHTAISYPAADASVFSVGSTDLYGNLSTFSNSGNNLDFVAPGEYVVAPTVVRGNASFLNGVGTSYSTPMAVATAALLKQINRNFTVQDIIDLEQNTPLFTQDSGNGNFYPRLDLFNTIYVARQSVASPAKARSLRASLFQSKSLIKG